MGSNSIPFLTKKGGTLSSDAIPELKITLTCKIVIKGEAPHEDYLAANERWNRAGDYKSVSLFTAFIMC